MGILAPVKDNVKSLEHHDSLGSTKSDQSQLSQKTDVNDVLMASTDAGSICSMDLLSESLSPGGKSVMSVGRDSTVSTECGSTVLMGNTVGGKLVSSKLHG